MTAARIRRIARHEFRTLRVRAVWSGGLVLALLLVTGLVARARHHEGAAQRARYQAMVEAQWAAQPDRHPHRVAHYGFLAFRPVPPLAAFDGGVDAYAGTTYFLEAHRQNVATFGDAFHGSGTRRFGELTPAVVLQLLVPLLVAALGFGVVVRERERGTWALLHAQGATTGELVAGKALALLAAVAAVVLPGAALLLLLPAGDAASGGDRLARGVALLAAQAAYLAGCVACTVAVSARARTSRGALAALLAAWVAGWVVLPRAVPAVAARLLPAPSRTAFDTSLDRSLRAVGDSHDPDDPFFSALRREQLARYGAADVKDLPINYGGLVSREGERRTSEVFEAAHRALRERHVAQERLVGAAGLLVPALAIRDLSMALAGTDAAHVEAFRQQAERYRYDIIQRLNDLHMREIRFENDRAQRLSARTWQAFPRFTPRIPTLSEAVAAASLALAGAVLWPLLAVALLIASARRSRP